MANSFTVNSLVIFEFVLIASCLYTIKVAQKHGRNPQESTLWSLGVGSMALAAFFGALRFGGLRDFTQLHRLTTNFSKTVGITCLLFGATITVRFVRDFHSHEVYLASGLVCAFILFLLSTSDSSESEKRLKLYQTAVMVALFAVAALQVFQNSAAPYVLLGIGALACMDPLKKPLSDALKLDPVDVIHIILAGAFVLFSEAIKA